MTQTEVPTPPPVQASQQNASQQPQNDLAVASMVLGLISFTGLGILTGLPAIIMGIIALKRPGGHAFSVTGIVTGAITSVLTLLILGFIIIMIALAASMPEGSNGGGTWDDAPYQQDTLVPGST